jgi:hypothetical protein
MGRKLDILNGVIGKGLNEKIVCEQKPKGIQGMCHMNPDEEQSRKRGKSKGPGVGRCLECAQTPVCSRSGLGGA